MSDRYRDDEEERIRRIYQGPVVQHADSNDLDALEYIRIAKRSQ